MGKFDKHWITFRRNVRFWRFWRHSTQKKVRNSVEKEIWKKSSKKFFHEKSIFWDFGQKSIFGHFGQKPHFWPFLPKIKILAKNRFFWISTFWTNCIPYTPKSTILAPLGQKSGQNSILSTLNPSKWRFEIWKSYIYPYIGLSAKLYTTAVRKNDEFTHLKVFKCAKNVPKRVISWKTSCPQFLGENNFSRLRYRNFLVKNPEKSRFWPNSLSKMAKYWKVR